jgi:hypothetical protein
VTCRQSEHLVQHNLGGLGRCRTVLGYVAEESIQATDAGFADPEVAQAGCDRGAQTGLVPLDGLRCEAFFCGDLFDPQLGELADTRLAV